jgi:hypothetical protein
MRASAGIISATTVKVTIVDENAESWINAAAEVR